MADVRLAMEGVFETVRDIRDSRCGPSTRIWKIPAAAAAVVLVGAVAAAAAWMLKPAEPRSVLRFSHRLGEPALTRPGRPVLAISSDGRRLVYVANSQLYLRNLDESDARPIPGTDENPSSPFFSPDGEWVGFWSSDSALKKIRVAGGTPVELTKAGNPLGVSWGLDDRIVYALNDGIWRVSANGGVAEHLVKTAAGERIHSPQMLPGGKAVLFTATTGAGANGWDEGHIVVFSLDRGERTVIHTGGADPRYVSTGHLVYVLENTLFALPFDADALRVRGGPVPVVPEVRRAVGADIGIAQYAISDNGSLIYVKGSADTQSSLVLADRSGSRKPLPSSTALLSYPRFNHDDSRIAVHRVDGGNPNIWIYEVSQSQWRQLTFNGGDRPEWTPDGRAITYRNGSSLWQIPSDFSGAAEQLPGTDKPGNMGPFAWSPDGEVLLYGATDGLRAFRPKAPSSDAAGKDTLLMKPPEGATLITRASFSPDGRWIVYTAFLSGAGFVYVSPFPVSVRGHRKIMNETVSAPIWNRDEIFVNSIGLLRVLGIKTQPALDWANPTTLFEIQGVAAPLGSPTTTSHAMGSRFSWLSLIPKPATRRRRRSRSC